MNYLLIIIAALAFSAAGPATKIAVQEMEIFSIVAGRSLIAALVLALICNKSLFYVWQTLKPRGRWLLIASGILLGLHLGCYVAGVKLTTYISAMTLVCLEPVVVVISGMIFFNIHPNIKQWLGIGLAMFGTLAIGMSGVSGEMAENIPFKQQLLGDFLLILAAAQFGIYYAINRQMETHKGVSAKIKKPGHYSLAYAAIIYFVAASVALLIQACLWLNSPILLFTASPKAWGSLLALGLLPTLFGHTLAQVIARRTHPSWAAMLSPGETLGAIVLGMIIFGSHPTLLEAIGGAVIMAGAVIVALSEKHIKPKIR